MDRLPADVGGRLVGDVLKVQSKVEELILKEVSKAGES